MAAATSALVDYGSTSEEDNFSDSEWREGPELLTLPPASASLGMSRWSSDASLSPDCPTNGWEQSDSPLHQSARAPDHPSPESLTVNSSSEGEAEGDGEATQQFSACRQGQQSEDDHTQSPTDAADSSSDSDNSNGRRPRWPLPMHSSTEEQKPASKRPRLQTSRRGAQGRGAYALKLHQLTAEMRELLARSRAFFTKPHSLQRPGGPVGMSTYSKAEERILCYLGFIEGRLRTQLTPAVLERGDFLEGYLDFLRDERKLSPATLSNHVSSLLYPLKYKHRASGPTYSDVPIIVQLRRASSQLQRQGELQRPRTVEQLRALNRWLTWDEVLEACRLQRTRFEVARERRHKAREAADLLLIALYTHIPPSRGLEMRTLEILHAENLQVPFQANDYPQRNIALLQQSGSVTIHIQLYKTQKFTGHDQVELEVDMELCRILKQYVKDFRPVLCSPDRNNDFLFLNIKGEPFSSGAFSRHIRGLFLKLTGCAVSVNGLRSAFVSWAYSQSNCGDSMKESLAVALRHSREQAQKTYDRRTANQKKAPALQFARKKAEAAMEREDDGSEQSPRSDHLSDFSVGDFVGLVMEDSTLDDPCVFVGRIQELLRGNQVCLLWYKHKGGALYSLEVEGDKWIEDSSALVPITVKPARGKPDCYRLTTSLRTIHKAVFDSRSL